MQDAARIYYSFQCIRNSVSLILLIRNNFSVAVLFREVLSPQIFSLSLLKSFSYQLICNKIINIISFTSTTDKYTIARFANLILMFLYGPI